MGLIAAIVGFVLRKAGVFIGLVLSLFLAVLLASALIPALQQAEADRERLSEVATERAAARDEVARLERDFEASQGRAVASLTDAVTREIASARGEVAKLASKVRSADAAKVAKCGFLTSLPEKLPFGPNPCAEAEAALREAQRNLATVQRNLGAARREAAVLRDPSLTSAQKLDRVGGAAGDTVLGRELENARADLARVGAEEEALREGQDSWAGGVVNLWAAYWRWIVLIAAIALLSPPFLRTLAYFVLMPLVQRTHRPIRLAGDDEAVDATLRTGDAERTLTVTLAPGEPLSSRSEFVRPVEGEVARSRVLYDLSSPFISYAAGLFWLSRITGAEPSTRTALAAPDDPDVYLMRVDFTDHPGVAMHPRHVVAVIGAPEVTTRWRWGLQALATGQVRHIMFAGTGSLVVQGVGDVRATTPGSGSMRMDQDLVMGWDARLDAGVQRTDVFWPYLRGKRPLIDHRFSGEGAFLWQKSVGDEHSNPLVRTFNAFFSALGKVLGF